MEEIKAILDSLIEEAKNEPGWKAENALRSARKEITTFLAPKTPIDMDDTTEEDGEELWLSYYACPRCFAGVNCTDNFCHRCGQELDWKTYWSGTRATISYFDELEEDFK